MKSTDTKSTAHSQHHQRSGAAFFQKEGGNGMAVPEVQAFFQPSIQEGVSPNNPAPFFSPNSLQPKLKIGRPGDKYEREADAMADKVVSQQSTPVGLTVSTGSGDDTVSRSTEIVHRQPAEVPVVQRKCATCGAVEDKEESGPQQDELLQRKPIFESEAEPPDLGLQRSLNGPAGTSDVNTQRSEDLGEEEELREEPQEVPTKLALAGTDASPEPTIQRKPIFESEAEPDIQTKCAVCAREDAKNKIQRQHNTETASSSEATPSLEGRLAGRKGSGAPLSEDTRHSMESAFGADFSGVRVHTDSEAVQMNQSLSARAFTHGSDIYFNAGEYNPGSNSGKHLLAHELTHTVQQGGQIQKKEDQNEPQRDENVLRSEFQELGDTEIASSDNSNEEVGKKNEIIAEVARFRSSERSEAEEGGRAEAEMTEGEPTILKPKESFEDTSLADVAIKPDSLPAEEPETPEESSADPNEAAGQAEGTPAIAQAALDAEPEIAAPPESLEQGEVLLPLSLKGMVNPPDSQGLRQRLPQRSLSPDELEELVQSGQSEADTRNEAARLIDEFRIDTDRQKEEIRTFTLQKKENLEGQSTVNVENVRSITADYVAQIRLIFAQKRTDLQVYAQQQENVADAELQNQITSVENSTNEKIQTAQIALNEKRTEFDNYVLQEKQELVNIATVEADRVDSELEAAANQTIANTEGVANRYQGSESPKPKQRSAARKVGREGARDMRDKKQPIRDDLVKQAVDFGERYNEYRETIFNQIAGIETALLDNITNSKTDSLASLHANRDAIVQRIDNRIASDLQVLQTAENNFVQNIEGKQNETIAQIERVKSQTLTAIDEVEEALIIDIENTFVEAEAVIPTDEEPYLPGVNDVIEAARAAIIDKNTLGKTQVEELTNQSSETLIATVDSFRNIAVAIFTSAFENADQLYENAVASIDQSMTLFRDQAATIQSNLDTAQQNMIEQSLAEIDRGINAAKSEINGFREQFRADIHQAANDSLEEAKKPLTDDDRDRAEEAADKAGESALMGFLRAVGTILVGLVILVVIALVVAVIAAVVFGVVLSAWTAVMIAGAILLVVGLVAAIIHRAGQVSEGHSPWVLLLAIPDVIGVTSIIESIRGRELVTDIPLDAGERTFRGVTGVFTLVMIVLGARAAVKGPPGGVYYRPVTAPGGWRGVLPRGVEGFREVGGELWESLIEFFRRRTREETPREETPREETPREETPREETPREETPREETPVDRYQACFVCGTNVLTPNGKVAIEEISIGDLVLSKLSENSGVITSFGIKAVHSGYSQQIVTLRLMDTKDEMVQSTLNHPFLVHKKGWISAIELKPGDLLVKDSGFVRVKDINILDFITPIKTYNLTVDGFETYFISIGNHNILVHNTPNFDQVLYWLLGGRPRVRPTDTDGLSVWKTTSRQEVNTLMETRVNVMGRSVKDPHAFWTEAQLQEAGLSFPETPGEGPLAEAGLKHHSVRPGDAPNAEIPLSEEQMRSLSEQVEATGENLTKVKPKDLNC
jgi:hypothetical protein